MPAITKEPTSTANELRIDENEVPDATGPPASGEAVCTFTRSTVERLLRGSKGGGMHFLIQLGAQNPDEFGTQWIPISLKKQAIIRPSARKQAILRREQNRDEGTEIH